MDQSNAHFTVAFYLAALDDIQAELLGSGNVWECTSWGQECDMDKTLTHSLYGNDYGAMRSVGGGTDGTDGTLIAFIVIAALIGGETGMPGVPSLPRSSPHGAACCPEV